MSKLEEDKKALDKEVEMLKQQPSAVTIKECLDNFKFESTAKAYPAVWYQLRHREYRDLEKAKETASERLNMLIMTLQEDEPIVKALRDDDKQFNEVVRQIVDILLYNDHTDWESASQHDEYVRGAYKSLTSQLLAIGVSNDQIEILFPAPEHPLSSVHDNMLDPYSKEASELIIFKSEDKLHDLLDKMKLSYRRCVAIRRGDFATSLPKLQHTLTSKYHLGPISPLWPEIYAYPFYDRIRETGRLNANKPNSIKISL